MRRNIQPIRIATITVQALSYTDYEIAALITLRCSASDLRIRRSLEDCTFADIFLNKVKGCDIKELYERHKLYDIEEKIIPYLKRDNEDVQRRIMPIVRESPPECDTTNSICKIDDKRLCICPKKYVCDRISQSRMDGISQSRVHQCVLLAYYLMIRS
ncbi:hypothetical protein Tcan_12575 [Toxocara canis]|uniref:Uncharacterized protein n=1 Tax=Toxocara canis TaxID=6265 RepID=A0A0B2W4C7_TOXCA|nr:hypothetical protein Tcan_12575 [Toxocara canis]